MMFKKWHITGRNNFLLRGLLILLAVVLAVGAPMFSASAASPADLKDLQPGTWYYAEVAGAVRFGLFQGVSDSRFGVDDSITRAQFITALVRLCGQKNPTASVDQFTDVTRGTWYYHYVSWAYSKGLVSGVSATRFDPERPINRQEMCKMLGAAIEWLTGETLPKSGAKSFSDRNQIDDWAKSWVDKCSANGLINGRENNRFDPLGGATRAEAACVIYRYYESAHPDQVGYTLLHSGFNMVFDADKDYYLCQATDFTQCRINGYTGFKSIKVEVEQYPSYFPYKSTAYRLGDVLLLGNGRAKITVTATMPSGSVRQYLIVIADPNGGEYAYGTAIVGSILRETANSGSAQLAKITEGTKKIYYLGSYKDGQWCKVQVVGTNKVGYIYAPNVEWGWSETAQPAQYKAAVDKLKKAHPNWSFTYVDVEMTYAKALSKYGAANEAYINPANYLTEDKIFAFLDIKTYDPSLWNDSMVKAVWANEKHISKNTALSYFNQASKSLNMNPVYIACRAALESGYGGSTFAKGTVAGYEGYYNFFGIKCYTSNPTVGAAYAKERNWNSVFRSIVEGANWVKDQYLDQGATTPYFFRFAGYQNKSYMDDVKAPQSEASILKRAYTDPNAKAHFIIPVYRNLP
ncbi:MAG: S-layer homology domain-containing protein [Clostridia bacterium]|nr:S-layer homology domain-containing protein [Clostridia bacterium]